MESQTDLKFISSSLLFIYEGDESADVEKPAKITLKMIDFAHVSALKDGNKDEGYIFGTKNLIEDLQTLTAWEMSEMYD